MAWRIAESLKTLRVQINTAYPNRDKASDGGIGDASHASRNSDHNPWVKDSHGVGVVTAVDIDEDLAPDIHSIEAIVSAIRKSKDPRVKYIIYEKRITVAGSNLQRWKAYTGKNPHNHHAHISVNSDPKLYDSTKPWVLDLPKVSAAVGTTLDPLPLASTGAIIDAPASQSEPSQAGELAPPTNGTIAPMVETTVTETVGDPPNTTETKTTTTETGTVGVVPAKPNIWTTVVAFFTMIYGYYKVAKEDFGNLVDRATDAIDVHFILNLAMGTGLVVLGIWLYNRSRQRAVDVTKDLIATAADQGSNTVILTK